MWAAWTNSHRTLPVLRFEMLPSIREWPDLRIIGFNPT
jgi:hypothetical protein